MDAAALVGRVRAVARRAVGAWRRRGGHSADPNFIGFDKYRDHGAYHWTELRTNREYRQKIDVISAYLHESDACLDLGCGDGAYVYALADSCAQVVGVDADVDAVRLANRELRKVGALNARCVQLPLSRVTPETVGHSGFEVVYSMDVLEHLPNPVELLDTARRMVSATGVVVIGTPLFVREDLVSEYHVKEYTKAELRALFSSFVVEREIVLPDRRADGVVHDESFFIAVCRPTPA